MYLTESYMSNYSVIVFISSLYMRPLLLLHISTFEDTSLYLCRLACTISIYSIYCFPMFSEIPSILGSSSNSVGWWRIGGSQRAQRERVLYRTTCDNLSLLRFTTPRWAWRCWVVFRPFSSISIKRLRWKSPLRSNIAALAPSDCRRFIFGQGVKVKAKMGSPLSAENRA